MTPLALATGYMDALFGEPDIDALADLLAPDLDFTGPFVTFDNAADYLDTLRASPPVGWRYQIIDAFDGDTTACLICSFARPGLETPMTLYVSERDGKIAKILLIFDTGMFK